MTHFTDPTDAKRVVAAVALDSVGARDPLFHGATQAFGRIVVNAEIGLEVDLGVAVTATVSRLSR